MAKTIKAKFTGRMGSNGFKTDQVYDLIVHGDKITPVGDSPGREGTTVYATVESFLENWTEIQNTK